MPRPSQYRRRQESSLEAVLSAGRSRADLFLAFGGRLDSGCVLRTGRQGKTLTAFARGTDARPATTAWKPIASGLLPDWLTGAHQPKLWRSRQTLGCLHFLGPLHTLILILRVAHGLSQHLVQLSLGSLRFPLGRLPLCHGQQMGMPEAELNPSRDLFSQRIPSESCLISLNSYPMRGPNPTT